MQAFQREAGEGWFELANDCDSPLGASLGHAMLACPDGGTARSRTIRLSNCGTNLGSLAPRPCGTSLPSPAKGPVNGRATFRPLGSHTGRKPSRACAKEASFCSRRAPDDFWLGVVTESRNVLQALRGDHTPHYIYGLLPLRLTHSAVHRGRAGARTGPEGHGHGGQPDTSLTRYKAGGARRARGPRGVPTTEQNQKLSRSRARPREREKTCTLAPHVADKVCVIRDNKKPHVKPFVMVLLALRV